MLKVFVLFGLVALALSKNIEVKECVRNGAIKIYGVEVSPYPIDLSAPTVTVSIDAELTQQLDNFELHLKIKKKVGIIWVSVPCVSNVGSCKYKDFCGMLDEIMANAECPAGANCQCPFPPERITITETIPIPEIPDSVSGLLSGKVWVEAKVVSGRSTLACVEVTAEIK